MPIRTSHGKKTTYDLHVHLDSHVGEPYTPTDYTMALLECNFSAVGFLLHNRVPPPLPPMPFASFRGAELSIPRRCRKPRGQDYLVGHVADGMDLVDAVLELAREGVDILAHPYAPGHSCRDRGLLFSLLAKEGISMEYNAAWGGPVDGYRAALSAGVQITFGSDAHGPKGISCDVPSFVTPLEELSFMSNRG